MTVAVVVQIGIYIVAGVCFIAGIILLSRGISARFIATKEAYNVGRLQAQRRMMRAAFSATSMIVLGVFFTLLAAYFPFGNTTPELASDDVAAAMSGSPTPSNSPAEDDSITPSPTETPIPVASATATIMPSATFTLDPPTPTPLSTATATIAPDLIQALVDSPVVGLYLRATPAGEILERLEDRTLLELQGTEQVIDDLRWVLVTAPSGGEGWVAAEFLIIDPNTDQLAPVLGEELSSDDDVEVVPSATAESSDS